MPEDSTAQELMELIKWRAVCHFYYDEVRIRYCSLCVCWIDREPLLLLLLVLRPALVLYYGAWMFFSLYWYRFSPSAHRGLCPVVCVWCALTQEGPPFIERETVLKWTRAPDLHSRKLERLLKLPYSWQDTWNKITAGLYNAPTDAEPGKTCNVHCFS